MSEFDVEDIENKEPEQVAAEESIPVGIARIREEWRDAGLVEAEARPDGQDEIEQVVFPEVDGGAGVGDYTLDYETVADMLSLSREAADRLISSGELDSILVRGSDGQPRRLVSESSFNRFRKDSAIDPDAVTRMAKAMADSTIAASIDNLRAEIEEIKSTQGKVLQQMKDILLLEVRNLKEQDRDLTSFVYELAEEIREALPKKKRK